MPEMTIDEYAAHRSVHKRAVSTALTAGRISRNANGWIDSEQADRDWAANTNPRISAANKGNTTIGMALRKARQAASPGVPGPAPNGRPRLPRESSPAGQAVPGPAPVVEMSSEIQQLTTARAVREKYAALLAKVEYEERIGKLIDKDGVVTAAHSMHKVLRDALLAIPDRIAAQLAAETDAVLVHRQLEAEIRTTLEQVSNMRQYTTRRSGVQEAALGNVG